LLLEAKKVEATLKMKVSRKNAAIHRQRLLGLPPVEAP
jgi:hypothetical protein